VRKAPSPNPGTTAGPTLPVTLGQLRRATDDLIELGRAIRVAALNGSPPPAETVDTWLRCIRDDVSKLSDAIATLWGAVPSSPAIHPHSEQCRRQLVHARVELLRSRLFAALSEAFPQHRAARLSPDARRRLGVALKAAPAIMHLLLPSLVDAVPSVTRRDVVAMFERVWPMTRGGPKGSRSTMFEPGLLLAYYDALRADHPHWSQKATQQTIADALVVDPKTIDSALRHARRSRKNT
jgi:hypothetical protein